MSEVVRHIDGDESPGAILAESESAIRDSRGCLLLYVTADGVAQVHASSIWSTDAAYLLVALNRWMAHRLEFEAEAYKNDA